MVIGQSLFEGSQVMSNVKIQGIYIYSYSHELNPGDVHSRKPSRKKISFCLDIVKRAAVPVLTSGKEKKYIMSPSNLNFDVRG